MKCRESDLSVLWLALCTRLVLLFRSAERQEAIFASGSTIEEAAVT